MFYVYDDKQAIGLLQKTTSIQWNECYNESGTFEVHANVTSENVSLLKVGNRIVNSEDYTIGFIELVLREKDSMEIRGHLDNLSERINIRTALIKNIQTDLYKLVEDNKRGLDITISPSMLIPIDLETTIETTWKTLRETFEEVCKTAQWGFKMVKISDEMNVIQIYEGKDTLVTFQEKIGNMVIREDEKDISKYKNVAYVAGEGEGTERVVKIVDISNGEPKREVYVDAKDIQSKWTDAENVEHVYSKEEYERLLINRGMIKLEENRKVESQKIDVVLDNQTFVYNVDYKLGDLVNIKLNTGVLKARLVRVQTIIENGLKRVGTLERVI